MIGDCGITIQNIDDELLPEIGYHIHKKYWRNGFGSEATRAVRDWAFENTKYECLYSYMKYTNNGYYSSYIYNVVFLNCYTQLLSDSLCFHISDIFYFHQQLFFSYFSAPCVFYYTTKDLFCPLPIVIARKSIFKNHSCNHQWIHKALKHNI